MYIRETCSAALFVIVPVTGPFQTPSNHASHRDDSVTRTSISLSYGTKRKLGTRSIKAKGAKGEKSFAARLLSSNIVLDLQFNLDTSLPLQIVHLLAPRASP